MGGKAVIKHVMDVLAEHKGSMVDISTIEKKTGLERKQIQSAIANARAKGLDIEVIVRGSVYRYGDDTAPIPTDEQIESMDESDVEEVEDLFVRIGWTDSMEPIIKANSSGEVFRAIPL